MRRYLFNPASLLSIKCDPLSGLFFAIGKSRSSELRYCSGNSCCKGIIKNVSLLGWITASTFEHTQGNGGCHR
jgi:hypothetical protein